MKIIRKIALWALSTSCLAIPSGASAQDDSQVRENAAVNDIIVTAQRREQSIIDVPLSIAALDGDALAEKGLGSVTDLKFDTPGFISQSGTGYTQIYIRGIGNNIFVGADPSVAAFIDDVPRVYGSLVDSFVNVERVEVLKGAQGGLYGRNATGGVINIITRQPDDEEFAFRGRFTAAEYQTVEASAYVNIPITDGVGLNFSAQRTVHDPYYKNIVQANPYPAGTTSFFGDPNSVVNIPELNNSDFYALDAKLKVDLANNLTVTLAGDYSNKRDADGHGWVQQEPERNYAIYRFFAARAGISNPVPQWPQVVPGKELYAPIDSYSYTKDYGFSGTATLDLNAFKLTSITALRWNTSQYRGDIGGAAVPIAGFQTLFERNNFYQEVRAISTFDGPFRLTGGATYYSDKVNSLITALFIGFPAGDTVSTIKTENWSVYGEASYDLTDALTLTGSLRYVEETKDGTFPPGGAITTAESVSIKQSKLLPSATLSYDLGEGTVYARFARGFKTGGINPIVRPSAFLGQPGSVFAPEVVDAFEAGVRTNLMNDQVQLTAALFYNDFANVQVARAGNASNPAVSNAILNLSGARTYGAEGSITWRISPAITVSANLGYLNAKYKGSADFAGNPVVDPFQAGGNRMALSPEWQGGAAINLDKPINDDLKVKAHVLYSHVGTYNYQYEENPSIQQPSYDIVNVRLGLAEIDEKFGIYAFANNLFDKYYSSFGTYNSLGSLLSPADPRVIGATLEMNF